MPNEPTAATRMPPERALPAALLSSPSRNLPGPPLPQNERLRLETLLSYEILDTPPEPSFDDIAHMAALLCGTPLAFVSLTGETRQWFKACVGPSGGQEIPRDDSFCTYAILQNELFVVPDTTLDARFRDNPHVTGGLRIRFYAAAPLITPGGFVLGTVCALDLVPRELSPQQGRSLEALARQVVSLLELRRMNLSQQRLIDELRTTNERLEMIQHATNDIIWDWDLVTGRVVWNSRITDVLGYTLEQVGENSAWWYRHIHPDEQERLAQSFQRALAEGALKWTAEYSLRRSNGTWARVLDRTTIQRDGTGKPVRIYGAVVDLSEREEMRTRLALTDRMASVGTLAAGVAHEINNPLAYVIANLDFTLQEVDTAGTPGGTPVSELSQALEEAREGAERMRVIVRDLKMFSRPDDERMELVDICHAIDSAATMAWNEIRHRARLVKAYQAVPSLYANEARLGQVFLNLLINAAHAIPEGAADRNEIHVSTRLDAEGRIVVEVRDTGSGIPEEIRPRILEPFFTTKPTGVGTGLGLSICHGIISSLGGELQFESEVGRGSVFRVVLSPPDRPEPVTSLSAPAAQSLRRGRILVVDDEPMVLSAVKRTLAEEHDVTLFHGARAALEWLEQGLPWDLILCDLMMPEMTGMDFHEELSRRMPERAGQVVFVTGGAFTARARDFLGRVSNPRTEKPFDARVLRELVNARLNLASPRSGPDYKRH
ncbi:ATP-binding protein [Stigmatella sp. ncwal1]|uniref:histidine kinase n=1 Tax=Stigmatella ashevillensis TaxID=2995309 RepID=A0ABT5DE52_9BACT|nr:ATP-binding protein [Stigmatella ashevillena]MDC0711959.1 ATP-binding protein [Stigmatella ashevillena]